MAGPRLPTRGRQPLVTGLPATSGWGLVAHARLDADQRSPAGRASTHGHGRPTPFFEFFFSCPPLFAQVVNSC
jgi:hypothetical protein